MHDIEIETTVSTNDDLLPSNTPDIVTIAADLAATFTFASHQNSIPVIRSRAKTWIIDRIIAGGSVTLSDRRIDLDAAYLAGLNEAERGDITLRSLQGDRGAG